jgi:hypothetical protein
MARINGKLRACEQFLCYLTTLLTFCRQSQSINPQYLSRIPHPSTSSKDRCLARKTDFCFSYSYLNPRFCELYKQLEAANAMPVSHTTDNFTSRTLLFSGIEVKPENGDLKEAELQMSIWMAASLRKKIEFAKSFQAGMLRQTMFSRVGSS